MAVFTGDCLIVGMSTAITLSRAAPEGDESLWEGTEVKEFGSSNVHLTPVGLTQLACAHREGQSWEEESLQRVQLLPLRKVRSGYLLQKIQGA
ncbi:hypothetical protein TNIN_322011 [Trichonephila inaurata madagascariensis]|uniref:Uncharacterized protein n=1 Tax=Trichonephila inaurata madagascariensis TaxID=2747483 RepID=A0A8X7C942_9ARAC|nr:hypothetical protein TNIN_322011 [Trichonephila inaurata madagascariensis]